MTVEHILPEPGNDAGSCTVVILYETDDVLSRAATLCDHIMQEHWTEVDIHVEHWSFEKLLAAETAADAAAEAATADVLVVATGGGDGLSTEFLEWTEVLLGARKHREGALVGLFPPGINCAALDTQLHHLAVRAGMDYLNRLPRSPGHGIPDQPDWCASRAETVTGTLDEIIRHKPRSGEG
jgi:hypothetical protein